MFDVLGAKFEKKIRIFCGKLRLSVNQVRLFVDRLGLFVDELRLFVDRFRPLLVSILRLFEGRVVRLVENSVLFLIGAGPEVLLNHAAKGIFLAARAFLTEPAILVACAVDAAGPFPVDMGPMPEPRLAARLVHLHLVRLLFPVFVDGFDPYYVISPVTKFRDDFRCILNDRLDAIIGAGKVTLWV